MAYKTIHAIIILSIQMAENIVKFSNNIAGKPIHFSHGKVSTETSQWGRKCRRVIKTSHKWLQIGLGW